MKADKKKVKKKKWIEMYFQPDFTNPFSICTIWSKCKCLQHIDAASGSRAINKWSDVSDEQISAWWNNNKIIKRILF